LATSPPRSGNTSGAYTQTETCTRAVRISFDDESSGASGTRLDDLTPNEMNPYTVTHSSNEMTAIGHAPSQLEADTARGTHGTQVDRQTA